MSLNCRVINASNFSRLYLVQSKPESGDAMTYLTRCYYDKNDKKLHLKMFVLFEPDRLLRYDEVEVSSSRDGQQTNNTPTIMANTPMHANQEKCSE